MLQSKKDPCIVADSPELANLIKVCRVHPMVTEKIKTPSSSRRVTWFDPYALCLLYRQWKKPTLIVLSSDCLRSLEIGSATTFFPNHCATHRLNRQNFVLAFSWPPQNKTVSPPIPLIFNIEQTMCWNLRTAFARLPMLVSIQIPRIGLPSPIACVLIPFV